MNYEPLVIQRLQPPAGDPESLMEYSAGDSRFIQKYDVITLKGHAHSTNKGLPIKKIAKIVSNAVFVAHSPQDLGMAVASWGDALIGGELFEEIFLKQEYPHPTLLGIPVGYDSDLPSGTLSLISTHEGEDFEIGRIVTRGPDRLPS